MIKNEKKSESYKAPIPSILQCVIIDVLKRGSMTRKEMVRELKIPRTTIYDNLNVLEKIKIVKKSTKNTGQIGRPEIYWSLILEE